MSRWGERLVRRTAALLSAGLICAAGCTVRPAPQLSPEPSSIRAAQPSRRPLKLEIVDEVNDGDVLTVLAQLTAETGWNAEEVGVRLSSYSDGRPADVRELRLSDRLPVKELEAGKQYPLVLSVPARDVTDYQLELVWGPATPEAGPALELAGLSIRTANECTAFPCAQVFSVSGDLINRGGSPVREVTLGTGFLFLPDGAEVDLSAGIPENEEPLTIEGITIEPGESQAINISMEQEIPRLEGGKIRPSVRILSFH